MNERELVVDCLRRLNHTGISYMLTGSMASNYWGIPRTTHDLDFVIQLPSAQVSKLVQEFQSDYHLDEVAVRAALAQAPYQFNAIDARSALKVDFWLLRPQPPFFERDMFARRLQAIVFGETAWLATAEDVILHKLFWNKITPSDRQLADAAGVMAIQKEKLDAGYLRRWARELGVAETMEDVLSRRIQPKTT
jgi:hypothetical protein